MTRTVAFVAAAMISSSVPVAPLHGAMAQARDRLDSRIPAANAQAYKKINDAKDWLNPILTMRAEGIEVASRHLTGGRKTVAAADLRAALMALPVAAWPYGRVVMATDIGLRRPDGVDDLAIHRNHDGTDRVLKTLDVAVVWVPSAHP